MKNSKGTSGISSARQFGLYVPHLLSTEMQRTWSFADEKSISIEKKTYGHYMCNVLIRKKNLHVYLTKSSQLRGADTLVARVLAKKTTDCRF